MEEVKNDDYHENASPCFDIGKREFNLPVDSARPEQSRVETLDPVGCKDDFHVSSRIETVQLIEQLQHGPLDFSFST